MNYHDWIHELPTADEDNFLRLLQKGQRGNVSWPTFEGAKLDGDLPIHRIIPNVPHPGLVDTNHRLFVFRQYPYFVGRINAVFKGVIKDTQRRSIILTGTPGIGKTTFLTFFMIYLIRHKEPFIVFREGMFHVVSDQRVLLAHTIPPLNNTPHAIKLFIDVEQAPPEAVQNVVDPSRFCVIYASSPEPANYKWLQKKREFMLVMNPCPEDELIDYVRLVSEIDQEPAAPPDVVVASFGPNLRTIWDALKFGFQHAIDAVEEAVSNLTVSTVDDLIRGAGVGRVAHSVVKTVCKRPLPSPIDPRYRLPDFPLEMIANNTGWRLLIVRLRKQKCSQVLRLNRALSYRADSAKYASWLFEGIAHDRLCEGGKFLLRELQPDPSNPACWTINPSSNENTLKFDASEQAVYTPSCPEQETSTPRTYYIPAATNNPTFDAFISPGPTRQYAIAFQMTLAASHTLKRSGLDLLAQRLKFATELQFIFVVPQGRTFMLTDPNKGDGADRLSSFWVLEIPLAHEYDSVLKVLKRLWAEEASLQRFEMEDPVHA